MKTLAVVTKGKSTCEALTNQLRTLLPAQIRVNGHFVDDINLRRVTADLIVASGRVAYQHALDLTTTDCPIILARRSINYHEVGQLLDLPASTDVLLVSDTEPAARDTISMLKALGIEHLNYYPYIPGSVDYPWLTIAVTAGETELVPACAQKVINIKTRTIDITTLTEILYKFEMLDENSNLLSANYVRDIILLTKATHRFSNQIQTIINTVHDGIIAIDAQQRIMVFNPVAEQFFSMPAASVIGKSPRQLSDTNLSAILDIRIPCDETIININTRNIVVNAASILSDDSKPGIVYTFNEVSEIQRIEENVRRKLVGKLHVARYSLDHVFGSSKSVANTVDLARRLAPSNAPILIQGESGTGKELLAQGIHNASSRKNQPFIAVNFAAMTESLLESELFGYEEGAFTGARKGGSEGLFEQAHKGTLFLDEVGDAPLPFQVKLLRVLQEKQVRRIGGERLIPIDVRIISATNQDLSSLVARGAFRRDLYYRLNVLPINVPALRERKKDILDLAAKFYDDFTAGRRPGMISSNYFSLISGCLCSYDWPGNIRELQNVIEYLVNISLNQIPDIGMLPREIRTNPKARLQAANQPGNAGIERLILETITEFNKQNITIGRRALMSILKLPERVVRNALDHLRNDGLIHVFRGRKGLVRL